MKDEELFPRMLKENPHKESWSSMMLFLREQVEAYAFEKWGGPEGLDQEFERRVKDKAERAEKKRLSELKGICIGQVHGDSW